MSPIEIIAITLSIIYILLAVKNRASCFVFGFIGSLLWAYASYFNYNLQWDAFLNLFYAAMSIYGLYIWTKGMNGSEMPIRSQGLKKHIFTLLISAVFIVIMTWFGESILHTSFAFLDALTTVLSIVGTIYLSKRYIGSWIYLLIADIIYIYVYQKQGATLFMWMMVLYSIMAIGGFTQWKKLLQSN